MQERLSELFTKAGLQGVTDRGQADRIVQAQLYNFWTKETSTYEAEIAGTFSVQDRGGRQAWKGTINGTAKGGGRSLKAENYQEVLSDAMVDLVQNLLSNSSFRKALGRNPHVTEAERQGDRGDTGSGAPPTKGAAFGSRHLVPLSPGPLVSWIYLPPLTPVYHPLPRGREVWVPQLAEADQFVTTVVTRIPHGEECDMGVGQPFRRDPPQAGPVPQRCGRSNRTTPAAESYARPNRSTARWFSSIPSAGMSAHGRTG